MQNDNIRVQASAEVSYGSLLTSKSLLRNREQYYCKKLSEIIDKNTNGAGGRFLEVGFDSGNMLRSLANIYKDAQFVGLEVREKCVNDMKALGYDCRLVTTEIFDMEEKFDVIYGFAVLHHMHNPYDTLVSLFNLLKPNGIMIFMKETHPLCILDIAYITISNTWRFEKNLFKMNKKLFIDVLSKYATSFYITYDNNPITALFKHINLIYCKFKMHRVPFFNHLVIFAKK